MKNIAKMSLVSAGAITAALNVTKWMPALGMAKSDTIISTHTPQKTKVQRSLNKHSKQVQFPVNERLDDGRHRYYMKYGVKVDRKAS